MSGLNKNKHKMNSRTGRNWLQLFLIGGLLYLLIVVVFALVIYNIPQIYDQINYDKTEATASEVQSALDLSSDDERKAALTDIDASNTLDIVVLENGQVLYSTVSTTDFSVITDFINENALSYHTAYQYESGGNTYQVWLAIYKTDSQLFFSIIISIIVGAAIMLSLILIVLVVILFFKVLRPLQKLRNNILKLKEYRLNEVHSGSQKNDYDFLSEELEDFTVDLQRKMKSITVKYTGLEYELQARQEKNIYKEQLISSLVHDLKTPLNIIMVQANKLEEGVLQPEEIHLLSDSSEQMLKDVNEILTIQKLDDISEVTKTEHVEVVEMIRKTMRLFAPLFRERKIQSYVDTPESIFINISPIKLKQIIHNVISNASQYADAGGTFELEAFEESQHLVIEAYNDKADISSIDFERVFDLFYHVDTGNTYGSGVGLYTIRSMVEEYGGTCSFAPRDNGVVLTISLPLETQ
ncbi:sensor histidine kinase [Culicoidibacter larvae]|uniref:histidine kinase n=1 Tax=Culicoidibacter larvae TaxID=2579976 RepID=A0A5R8Q859_9FIRM|nr:HAMP domain-containing sensor histidine kinase [Culicoidibacter larvae]TLG71768.1 HAMP domain-containing histidine kinase [Culicoidibacter larvae]